MLSKRQLFEFDLNGFLIIPDFLKPTLIKRIHDIINQDQKGKHLTKFDFMELDPHFFLTMMADDRVISICDQLIGPHFRFDNAFGYQDDPAYAHLNEIKNLHAGPISNQGLFQYRWINGHPYSGALQFCYALDDVTEGDGGLIVVPGSHKNNYAYEGGQVLEDILQGDLDVWWVKNPSLKAGDLLIFTEALVHGSRTWQPKDRGRRHLYFKYCPGYAAWTHYARIENLNAYATTPEQKKLLRPPYVADRVVTDVPPWQNVYKERVKAPPSFGKKIKYWYKQLKNKLR